MAKEQKTGKIAEKPQKKAFSDIQKILEHRRCFTSMFISAVS